MEDAPQQKTILLVLTFTGTTSAGACFHGRDISWCSPLWAGQGIALALCKTAGPRTQQGATPLVAPGHPEVGCRWGQTPGVSRPGTSFQHHGLDLLPVRRWGRARQVGTRVPPATTAGQLLGDRNRRAAQYLARGRWRVT